MLIQLITQERAQKLDLLVHLIRNLRQSLVIFGPKGIGKSTFLKSLKESKSETGAVLLLAATNHLNFEQIQEQLFKELMRHVAGGKVDDLEQLLQVYDKHNQYVVLLIDDAGQMVPGLIATLVQYAARFNNLRIVFALTQEELGFKHKTDGEIEDCHFMEIPPLSLSQCGEYVQYLNSIAAEANANKSVNDAMIERIYKKTGGIPGKIVEELPSLSAGRVAGSGWIYALVLAGLTSIVVGVLLWRNISNVVTSDTPAATASTAAVSLAIPGQLKSEVLDSSVQGTATASVAENSTQHATHPEITNSKPDYYTGYARVRDADALDEFNAKGERNKGNGEQADQVKVEIITPEQPPKEVVIANADVQLVRDNAPHEQTKLTPSANDKQNQPVVQSSAGPKLPVPLVKAADLTTKSLSHDTALEHKAKKPEIKSTNKELGAEKIELVKAKSKETKPKSALKEAVRIADEAQQTDNVAVVAKTNVPQEKIAENNKSKPETIKLDEASQIKQVKDVKPSSEEKKVAKVEQVEESPKQKIIKVEAESADISESKESPKAAEKIKQEAKEGQAAVDKPKVEPSGLAKLGVVMKYKSEEDVVVEPSVKVEKKARLAKELTKSDAKVAKPSGNTKYTLQLMTFSQQQSLQSFMSKYSSMGGGLRHFTVHKDGNEHYVVVFGNYDNVEQANAAKQKLPPELQKALARKM